MNESPCPACKGTPLNFSEEPIDLCARCTMEFILEEPGGVPGGEHPVGSLLGDYRILGVLGRGGMGIVYKAVRKGSGEPVALKVLASGSWTAREEIEKLNREARALSRLHHPNIIPVLDISPKGEPAFFTMEYVEGKTLAQELEGKSFGVSQAVTLIMRLARALQHVHDNGIIHRDLKPANILLDRNGIPLLIDFGLAIEVSGQVSRAGSWSMVGTPAYMSPEQASGEAAGKFSDIYSLGVILYEILTARMPSWGDCAIEVLDSIRKEDPVRPCELNPGVDRELESIVVKCLQKKTERRYLSAGELAGDLEKWLSGERVRAVSSGLAGRVMHWFRSRWSQLKNGNSRGQAAGAGVGGERGWFTPVGSDIDSSVAGDP